MQSMDNTFAERLSAAKANKVARFEAFKSFIKFEATQSEIDYGFVVSERARRHPFGGDRRGMDMGRDEIIKIQRHKRKYSA